MKASCAKLAPAPSADTAVERSSAPPSIFSLIIIPPISGGRPPLMGGMMMRLKMLGGALLLSTAVSALGAGASFAQDAFMDEAKAYIETVTAPVTEWTGPTTGPKAQPDKL